MSEATKILVVDDEIQITRVLRRGLEAEGFHVRTADSGRSAIDMFRAWGPDLIITDLSMPGLDGLELCRRLRQITDAPIVVLSVKEGEPTKVQALDLGADDYVTKPFGMQELVARVRALLRRTVSPRTGDEEAVIGDFRIVPKQYLLEVRGRSVRLTPKEFERMQYFLSHPGKVLRHRAILDAVWGSNRVEQHEYLRVFVGNLRKKLEKNPRVPRYIRTEPWIGYRFDPQ
jgi:two-component system KDP operon response regulator KdpE